MARRACQLVSCYKDARHSGEMENYLWDGTAKAVDAFEFDAVERFWLFSRAESLLPASPR